jgi:hypothetical protein
MSAYPKEALQAVLRRLEEGLSDNAKLIGIAAKPVSALCSIRA